MAKLILDLNKNVEENAETYFNKAKKIKKKLAGAKEALGKSLREYENLKKLQSMEKEVKEETKRKREWYEKFRWFISSEGLLVIGGRDATTNEIVIKKHTSKGDLVFHTDIAGSPFFVVKAGSAKIGDATIREAADATCSFSRAFKLGMSTTPVFYVKPEQVSKEAPSGEYLAKGAFMIRGKTTYVDSKINVAVGIKDGRVMAGPVEAIKENCKKYVEIKQGRKKTSDVAKFIQKKIGGELDEIIRTLPSGGCDIKKK
jgi:predicted ribosome quality control (RQC) complex YloA/Tae2 family protein